MEPTKTILVPVDFEAASMAALRTADELARRADAKVVLVHAFSVPPYAYRGISESLLKKIRQQAHETALGPLDELKSRWGVETLLREGDPAAQILRAAKELHADRIVMGTHGHRGFDRLMFGSVAETVIRKSSVPVMVVRPAEGPVPPRAGQPVVLCAVDCLPGSRRVLELAAAFAREIGGALHVVHTYALPMYVYPGFDPVLAGELDAELMRSANQTVEALAEQFGAAQYHVCGGEPGRTILEVANELQPVALVLGTHGRRGLGRLFLGSVAEWVLRRSPFPVLTTHVASDAEVAEAEARTETEARAGAA